MGETEPTAGHLAEWTLSLKASRKSPETIRTYTAGVQAYLDYCAEAGLPTTLTRRALDAFTVYLTEVRGNSEATVASRQLSVRRFSAWLAAEGIIEPDTLSTYVPVRPKPPVMEPLTEAEITALLAACKPTNTLRNTRDEALIRLMAETGLRASEAVGLLLDDVDPLEGRALVRSGKGGKHRTVGFGPRTGQAIVRYLRYRDKHALAATPALWLGDRGKSLRYDGLHKALAGRAQAAGITRFHPHLLRNTFAHRWLEAGGSVPALMAQGGWTSLDMVNRYSAFHQNTRAVAEAHRLNIGDVG